MANNNSSVHQKSLWKIKDSYKHRVVRANTKNRIKNMKLFLAIYYLMDDDFARIMIHKVQGVQ